MNIIRPMIMQTFNPRIRDLRELTMSHRQAPDKALLAVVIAYVAVEEKAQGLKARIVSHQVGCRPAGY